MNHTCAVRAGVRLPPARRHRPGAACGRASARCAASRQIGDLLKQQAEASAGQRAAVREVYTHADGRCGPWRRDVGYWHVRWWRAGGLAARCPAGVRPGRAEGMQPGRAQDTDLWVGYSSYRPELSVGVQDCTTCTLGDTCGMCCRPSAWDQSLPHGSRQSCSPLHSLSCTHFVPTRNTLHPLRYRYSPTRQILFRSAYSASLCHTECAQGSCSPRPCKPRH